MKNDTAIVAQALAGGPEAFAPIVERYQDAVFGIALARLRNFHDAEDVAQGVFIEAYQRLGTLKEPGRLGAWLRSITVHHCIDALRRRSRVITVPDVDEELAGASARNVEKARHDLRQLVLAAIGRLSKTQSETTTLFYIDGYSVQEVAAIQEVPVGTVKRRLHDARLKLKEEMMGMVEDTLKSESPRRELARKVYEILERYDRPSIPWQRWGEIKEKLREIGTDGMEGFIRALESPHSPTRRFAVSVLTDAGQSQEMVEKLLKEATRDSNKKVRRVAFGALFDIAWHNEEKRKDLMPHILPALRDRSKKVRCMTAWSLAHFPGFAQHVPLEEAARAVVAETETDPLLLQSQHHLLEAVLCVREGKENPYDKFY